MALFNDMIVQEIAALVRQRYLELGAALGEPYQQESLDQLNTPRVLQRNLELLIGVANGEYHRTDETVRRAEQALTHLIDLLLGNSLHSKAIIPDDF